MRYDFVLKQTFFFRVLNEHGHVHLEPGKRMSVLEQNHNAFDDFMVLETVVMGNKNLFKVKSEIDRLYENYTDENAFSSV